MRSALNSAFGPAQNALSRSVAGYVPSAPMNPELVTNGDFSNGATGWVVDDASVTANTGALVFNATAGAFTGKTFLTLDPVTTYVFQFDSVISSGQWHIYFGGAAPLVYFTASGHTTIEVTTGASPAQDVFFQAITYPASGSFDNVSVKKK